jgi:hypothetical protein
MKGIALNKNIPIHSMSNKPGITNPFDNQALNGVNDFSMM